MPSKSRLSKNARATKALAYVTSSSLLPASISAKYFNPFANPAASLFLQRTHSIAYPSTEDQVPMSG